MIKLTGDSPSSLQTDACRMDAAILFQMLVLHMSPRPLPLHLAIALAVAGLGGVSACPGNAAAAEKISTDKTSPDKISTDKARDSADNDNTLPASVRRIERETGGKVLKAQPIQRDGREIYRVKIVTPQGRVRVVEDDVGPPAPQPPANDGLPPPRLRHRL